MCADQQALFVADRYSRERRFTPVAQARAILAAVEAKRYGLPLEPFRAEVQQ